MIGGGVSAKQKSEVPCGNQGMNQQTSNDSSQSSSSSLDSFRNFHYLNLGDRLGEHLALLDRHLPGLLLNQDPSASCKKLHCLPTDSPFANHHNGTASTVPASAARLSRWLSSVSPTRCTPIPSSPASSTFVAGVSSDGAWLSESQDGFHTVEQTLATTAGKASRYFLAPLVGLHLILTRCR